VSAFGEGDRLLARIQLRIEGNTRGQLPHEGETALPSGPLPAVTRSEGLLTLTDGVQVWIAPPLAGGRTPRLCTLRSDHPGAACEDLRRTDGGIVGKVSYTDGAGAGALLLVTDARAEKVIASSNGRANASSVIPAGDRYSFLKVVFTDERRLGGSVHDEIDAYDAGERIVVQLRGDPIR
jgi:hypothetical protein